MGGHPGRERVSSLAARVGIAGVARSCRSKVPVSLARARSSTQQQQNPDYHHDADARIFSMLQDKGPDRDQKAQCLQRGEGPEVESSTSRNWESASSEQNHQLSGSTSHCPIVRVIWVVIRPHCEKGDTDGGEADDPHHPDFTCCNTGISIDHAIVGWFRTNSPLAGSRCRGRNQGDQGDQADQADRG